MGGVRVEAVASAPLFSSFSRRAWLTALKSRVWVERSISNSIPFGETLATPVKEKGCLSIEGRRS